MSGCLDQLLGDPSFLTERWPDQHLVRHGPLDRLGPLVELPELQDLELLLGAFRDQVRVVLADKRDEHSSLMVDGVKAAALHREGMALVLEGVERFFPIVDEWLGSLRRELGLPPQCEPRSLIYVTPSGAGNSPHFDANANFVVQLRGTKRWHVAPNRHVPHPTDRWAMNEPGLSGELSGYVEGPLPTEPPADAEVIDLAPGSVLFVPRGYWHWTEADEDTLALNFTFGQPTWADVVLDALRRRLLKDASWRELATASPKLLEKLAALGVELEPEEVLEAFAEAPLYELVPEAFLSVEDGAVTACLGEDELQLETDPRLLPVLAWLGEQGGPFSREEAGLLFPSLSSGLPALFHALEAKGLLARTR